MANHIYDRIIQVIFSVFLILNISIINISDVEKYISGVVMAEGEQGKT